MFSTYLTIPTYLTEATLTDFEDLFNENVEILLVVHTLFQSVHTLHVRLCVCVCVFVWASHTCVSELVSVCAFVCVCMRVSVRLCVRVLHIHLRA